MLSCLCAIFCIILLLRQVLVLFISIFILAWILDCLALCCIVCSFALYPELNPIRIVKGCILYTSNKFFKKITKLKPAMLHYVSIIAIYLLSNETLLMVVPLFTVSLNNYTFF